MRYELYFVFLYFIIFGNLNIFACDPSNILILIIPNIVLDFLGFNLIIVVPIVIA